MHATKTQYILHVGASTVEWTTLDPYLGLSESDPKVYTNFGCKHGKWTTLDPCSGLSESDPKQYTNFEFHEIENHKHLENI